MDTAENLATVCSQRCVFTAVMVSCVGSWRNTADFCSVFPSLVDFVVEAFVFVLLKQLSDRRKGL